jgi:hypothetical protein
MCSVYPLPFIIDKSKLWKPIHTRMHYEQNCTYRATPIYEGDRDWQCCNLQAELYGHSAIKTCPHPQVIWKYIGTLKHFCQIYEERNIERENTSLHCTSIFRIKGVHSAHIGVCGQKRFV